MENLVNTMDVKGLKINFQKVRLGQKTLFLGGMVFLFLRKKNKKMVSAMMRLKKSEAQFVKRIC